MSTSPRGTYHRAAQPGQQTLVLLHGWGADCYDLVPVVEELGWQGGVLSINAPILLGDSGFAWFPRDFSVFQKMDPLTYFHTLGHELWDELPTVADYLADALKSHGITSAIVCGFSQGAIVSLSLALAGLWPIPPSAILAFSPGLWDAKGIRARLESGEVRLPPVFMSHGKFDPILPFHRTGTLASILQDSGKLAFEFVQFDGYHEIPYNVLEKAREFLGRI